MEIFEKEVNLFGKCLLLSEQMYPSFGVNACFFSAKARLFTTQNSAFGAEKPGFPPFFLPVHRF